MGWIVLASRVEANIFENTACGSLRLLKTFCNPLGRLKNKKLQRDKSGMNRARFKNSAPYSLTAEKDPHEDAASQLAKKLADYLIRQWNQNHELTFKIVAEPHLLGLIKSQFGKSKILNQASWLRKDLQNVPTSKWPKILGLQKIPMNKDMEATQTITN